MTDESTVEIELKFRVTTSDWPRAESPRPIEQGYLCVDVDRTVRVRRSGDRGALTVKGRSQGGVRREFEYAIPMSHAVDLLQLCGDRVVTKVRHEVEIAGLRWEIDEFTGRNQGLVVAEVELDSVEHMSAVRAARPDWAGEEVTDDHRFANAALAERPFEEWST